MATNRQPMLPLTPCVRRNQPGPSGSRPGMSDGPPGAGSTRASRARSNSRSRWGAAVVELERGSVSPCWEEVRTRISGGRRTAVWVEQGRTRAALANAEHASAARSPAGRRARAAVAVPRSAVAAAGDVFAENRINHALELFGACMLIVAFLAVAMFV